MSGGFTGPLSFPGERQTAYWFLSQLYQGWHYEPSTFHTPPSLLTSIPPSWHAQYIPSLPLSLSLSCSLLSCTISLHVLHLFYVPLLLFSYIFFLCSSLHFSICVSLPPLSPTISTSQCNLLLHEDSISVWKLNLFTSLTVDFKGKCRSKQQSTCPPFPWSVSKLVCV